MQAKNCNTRSRLARHLASTTVFALALGLPLSLALPAQAFEVTEAQREACTPDAFRLCSAEIPDADRVAACMDVNVRNLSPACRAVFHPIGATAEATPGTRHRVRRVLTSYEHHRHHHLMHDADGRWARD
jgi:hypothetical protein